MLQQKNNPNSYSSLNPNPQQIQQYPNNQRNIQIKGSNDTIGIEKINDKKKLQKQQDCGKIATGSTAKVKDGDDQMLDQFQEQKQKFINQQLQQQLKQEENQQQMEDESQDQLQDQYQQAQASEKSPYKKSSSTPSKNRYISNLNFKTNQSEYQHGNNVNILANQRKRRQLKQQKQELTSIFSQLICLINNKVSQIDQQCEKNKISNNPYQQSIHSPNNLYSANLIYTNSINAQPNSSTNKNINDQKQKSRNKMRSKKEQEQRQNKIQNKYLNFINNKSQQIANSINSNNINSSNSTLRKNSIKQKQEKFFNHSFEKQKQKSNIVIIDKIQRQRCKKQIFSNYFTIMSYKIHNQLDDTNMEEEVYNTQNNKVQIYNTTVNPKNTSNSNNKSSNLQQPEQHSSSKCGNKFSVFQEVSLTIVPSSKNPF